MNAIRYLQILALLTAFVLPTACNDFLDERTSKKLVVPHTLRDWQALLDTHSSTWYESGDGEAQADDYYLEDAAWMAISSEEDRRAYIWAPDYCSRYITWFYAYRNVNTANVVLNNIHKTPRTEHNHEEWDDIKGQAHFLRGRAFLSVAINWAMAFDNATATTDLGIPLPLIDDFNIVVPRSNLQDTYKQIIEDLETAANLMGSNSIHPLRAAAPAALALLARTHLFMRNYEKCLQHADLALQLKSDLLDFNALKETTALYPFENFNEEVIYAALLSSPTSVSNTHARVDSILYLSYSDSDLRKRLYFQAREGYHSFRGSYLGNASNFGGISVAELYLMRAE